MGKIDKNKTTTTKAFRRQQPLKKSNKENEKIPKIKSIISSALSKGKTKKAKRETKKSSLLEKLKKSSVAKEKIQRAKEKAQRPVIGNMDPLLDALTSIIDDDDDDEEMDDTPGHTKQTTSSTTGTSTRRANKHPSEKSRNRANMKDMELFNQVMSHPKFNNDPINAISDHVKFLIQIETSADS